MPLTRDEDIRLLLTEARTIAVFGCSDRPDRPSYGVAAFLQARGKRIVPVHPQAETVHGEQGYASVDEIPFDVDVVDLFVRSELAGPVVDAAIAKGAKAVWMQLGVVDRFERV